MTDDETTPEEAFQPWMIGFANMLKSGNAKLDAEAKEKARKNILAGDVFMFDAPDTIEGIWGTHPNVLWAKGEPFMIAGNQGAGKTTIAQQLMLGMVGVPDFKNFLGLPVAPLAPGKKILYLAMDRPMQARRSVKRMWEDTPDNRDLIRTGMMGQVGPLPPLVTAAMATNPLALAEWLVDTFDGEVSAVVVDSLKDFMPGLTKDDVGAIINSQWQGLMQADIDLLDLHHERKAGAGDGRAVGADNIYGSTWLTSGHGSVLQLIGNPGDEEIVAHHVKQPGEVVGPLHLIHDHALGRTVLNTASAPPSVIDVARSLPDYTITIKSMAEALAEHNSEDVNEGHTSAAKRALAKAEKAVEIIPAAKIGRAKAWSLLPILQG